MLQPGKSAEHGQHWFYRLDGHRKCWFQAAEETVSIKKPVRQHSAKQTVIASEENEAGLRRRTVVDARAELLSDAPANAFQPTPPAPEVVDPASVPANAAATVVPAVPFVAEPALDQLTPEHATRRPVDVEMLLAEAPLARDMVASSVPPAAPGAPSIPDADHRELMATQAGVVLIALGLVLLLVGSLRVRRSLPRVAPIRRA